jgi:hypothetical protein
MFSKKYHDDPELSKAPAEDSLTVRVKLVDRTSSIPTPTKEKAVLDSLSRLMNS